MPDMDGVKHVLTADPRVRLAVVFGSAARGTSAHGSDLDIGLIAESGTELASLEVELARAARSSVDLIDLSTAPPLLRFEIARDGIVLLERRPHDWSDFRARAMVDWWDWAPTARLFQKAAASRLRRQAPHGPS